MKIVNADCPICARSLKCDVLRDHKDDWADTQVPIEGTDIYRILRCRGCETVFFGLSQFNSEDFVHDVDRISGELTIIENEKNEFWPKASEWEYPKWFSPSFEATHENLAELLEGVYEAYENDRLVLTAIGIRTCFDHTAEGLGIEPENSFKEKVNELRKSGHISPREMETLKILTDAGSAAAHRAWRPNKEQCELMINTLESFIQRSIILPEDLDDLKNSVPQRSAILSDL